MALCKWWGAYVQTACTDKLAGTLINTATLQLLAGKTQRHANVVQDVWPAGLFHKLCCDAKPALRTALQEIFEYLHPMTGLADLAGAEGSVHRVVAELSAHGGRHFPGSPAAGGSSPEMGASSAAQASMDIELGLAPPLGLGKPSLGLARPSLGRPSAVFVAGGAGSSGSLRRVSMQRGMVRVDGTESLTAITGGCNSLTAARVAGRHAQMAAALLCAPAC